MAPQPLITSAPLPIADDPLALVPTATILEDGTELVKRQQVVTLSVTASSSATPSAAASKGFPVAVAVPALVGGMAAAIAGFLLFWWLSKRSKRKKALAYEAHQRRQARKRANSKGNQSGHSRRPSAQRNPSSGQKSPINEKGFVPPVPALPKNAYQQQGHPPQQQQYQQQQYGQYDPNGGYGKGEYGYGYAPQHNEYNQGQGGYEQQYGQSYPQQPAIEQEQHAQPQVSPTESTSSTAPLNKSYEDATEEDPSQSSKSARPSRSTARVAAAEKAAEAAFGDPNTRYQPKKPSPLALKAMEKQAGQAGGSKWGDGPFRVDQGLAPPQQAGGNRQVSGEWGVALGSPDHDGSFEQKRSSYSNDPYLNANVARGKSGMYSNDPYAGYHNGGEEMVEEPKSAKRWI